MSHLVQLLLPLQAKDGQAFPKELFRRVREELLSEFGGLTTYSRVPAHGLWAEDGTASSEEDADHDDIVVFEVMVEELDRTWWEEYRETLRREFQQESLVVRASPIEML